MFDTKATGSSDSEGEQDESPTQPFTSREQIAARIPEIDGYRLRAELGRGGMGVVYEADDLRLQRTVALKVLAPGRQFSTPEVKRFNNEALAVAALSHENIVPLYQIGDSDGIHFFTMKLIRGSNLASVVRSARELVRDREAGAAKESTLKDVATTSKKVADSNTLVSSDLSGTTYSDCILRKETRSARKIAMAVARVGQQAAEALQHAHDQGIIHRDIKPSNLLVDQDEKVWVADFGLAQLRDSATVLTQSGDIIGTLQYMSPEQASGRRAFIDHRTDIYSLGITLYELVTLNRACRGRTAKDILRELTFERPVPIARLNPGIPKSLGTIIGRAIERNPADRYQSAAEFSRDLQRYLAGKTPTARPVTRWKRIRNWIQERPKSAAALVAALVLMFSVSTVFGFVYRNSFVLEQQRRKEAEGGRLTAYSLLNIDSNPGLALQLGILGATLAPGIEADRAIVESLDNNHEVATLAMEEQPQRLAFSGDGSRLVVWQRASSKEPSTLTAKLIDTASQEIVHTFEEQCSELSCVFSPDGQYLLVSCRNAELDRTFGHTRLCDAATGELHKSFSGMHIGSIASQPFGRGETRLAMLNESGGATLFGANLEAVGEIPAPASHFTDVSISPDGDTIALVEASTSVNLFVADGQQLRQVWERSNGSLALMQFSSDSRTLLVGTTFGVHAVSLKTPEMPSRFLKARHAHFTPDGKAIVLVSGTRSPFACKVRSTDSFAELSSWEIDDQVDSICVLADNRHAIVASAYDTVVMDYREGKVISACKGHEGLIQAIAAKPKSDQFATCSADGTVRIWDRRSDRERREFDIPLRRGNMILAHHSSNRAVVGTVAGMQTVLVSSNSNRTTTLNGELKELTAQQDLVLAKGDKVEIWSPDGSRRKAAFLCPGDLVASAFPLPDSEDLLLRTYRRRIHLWADGQLATLTTAGVGPIYHSSNGKFIAYAADDGKVYLLDADERSPQLLLTSDSEVTRLAISDDGLQLVSAHSDKRLKVWETKDGKLIDELVVEGRISQVSFVSERLLLLTKGDNGSVLSIRNLADATQVNELVFDSDVRVELDLPHQRLFLLEPEGVAMLDLETLERSMLFGKQAISVASLRDRLFLTTTTRSESSVAVQKCTLVELDIVSGETVQEVQLPLIAAKLRSIPHGNAAVVSGRSYGAAVLDVGNLQTERVLLGHSSQLVFSDFASEQTVVSVPGNGQISVDELSSGEKSWLGDSKETYLSAKLTPDRKFLVTASPEHVSQWNLRTGDLIRRVSLEAKGRPQINLDRRGNIVAFTDNQRIRVWDMRDDSIEEIGFAGEIRHFAISPDSSEMTVILRQPSADSEQQKRIPHAIQVKLSTKKLKNILVPDIVRVVQYVGAGKHIALLSTDGRVFIWDAEKDLLQNTLQHTREFLGLLPSDSELVITVVEGGIMGWDPILGGILFGLHDLDLNARFSSRRLAQWNVTDDDSDWIFGYSAERVFLQPRVPLAYAKKNAPRGLTPAEHELYRVPDEFASE